MQLSQQESSSDAKGEQFDTIDLIRFHCRLRWHCIGFVALYRMMLGNAILMVDELQYVIDSKLAEHDGASRMCLGDVWS